MTRHPRLSPTVLGVLLVCAVPAAANEPQFVGSSGRYTQVLDCAQKPKAFDPFSLAWLVDDFDADGPLSDTGDRSIRCVTHTSAGGVGRKGVKVRLDGEILDLDGDPLMGLPARNARTDRNGYAVHDWSLNNIPAGDVIAMVDAKISGGNRKTLDYLKTDCQTRRRIPCEPDSTTLCLLDDNRFKVDVDWSTSSESGMGQVVSSGQNSGSFYFFNPGSTDLLVQLLDACSTNGSYEVRLDGRAPSSVQYEVTVTDTVTGTVQTYGSPLSPGGDTDAFATCP